MILTCWVIIYSILRHISLHLCKAPAVPSRRELPAPRARASLPPGTRSWRPCRSALLVLDAVEPVLCPVEPSSPAVCVRMLMLHLALLSASGLAMEQQLAVRPAHQPWRTVMSGTCPGVPAASQNKSVHDVCPSRDVGIAKCVSSTAWYSQAFAFRVAYVLMCVTGCQPADTCTRRGVDTWSTSSSRSPACAGPRL